MKRMLTTLTLLLTLILPMTGCVGRQDEIAPPPPTQSPITIPVTIDGLTPHKDQNQPFETYLDELEFSPEYLVSLTYAGYPYAVINDNEPYFTAEERARTDAFEIYPELDSIGRCGACTANICEEIMPTEERGEIGMVKPSGWQTARYDVVEGKYLYNRCHLIGFQLAGENSNTRNLITGTRYMNVQGMLPFENAVADYVHQTSNHVMYRVTPIFQEDDLVARGVLMEAYSVEDDGQGLTFNVYCFNAQPGVGIDYATGNNWEDGSIQEAENIRATSNTVSSTNPTTAENVESYVLNTRSMKFHLPTCPSVGSIAEYNRQEVTNTRDALLNTGYEPCGNCSP